MVMRRLTGRHLSLFIWGDPIRALVFINEMKQTLLHDKIILFLSNRTTRYNYVLKILLFRDAFNLLILGRRIHGPR